MNSVVYDNELQERATSTDSLDTRIQLNDKYSSTNFEQWLFERLQIKNGEDILDVGCGTGAQALPMLKRVGSKGSVSALDISDSSVELLKEKARNSSNLQALALDMARLEEAIDNVFRIKQYDIAHSSYALYYSSAREQVLDIMRKALKPTGRLVVFTPNAPHGMVNFIKQFSMIPHEVEECFVFGPNVLERYFRKHFWNVTIHLFHNVVRVPSKDDFANFYRSTTYYDSNSEAEALASVQKAIDAHGYFEYEKNGYLIIGEHQIQS